MENFSKDNIPPQAKILIIKLRSIGDVVCNTAVYSPLKRCFPHAHLAVVVEAASYDLVRDHPDVDEVVCFEKGSLWKQITFYMRQFLKRYDVVIDMHGGPRGALMCFLTGARIRIGNASVRRSFLYNVRLSLKGLPRKHPIDFQVGLLKKIGVVFDREPAPAIHISPENREHAAGILAEHDIGTVDKFCIIHPGARLTDQWQPEKFAHLADYFHSAMGLKVVFTCGPGQEEQVERVMSLVQHARPVFFVTGLQKLAAITEKAQFVLCHNGGYMHLTAALGTPVVALFSWSRPDIWKPPVDHAAALYSNLECHPCTSKTIKPECTHGVPECKGQITEQDVLREIDQLLGHK